MKLHMLVLLSAMVPGGAVLAANADAIYFGGPILTVNDKAPRTERSLSGTEKLSRSVKRPA